ncbi:hypothetical protein NST44_16030 [Paenibacillus sp. FSL W8-0919]|uniref:hypothetical protein n=1 Tax=Paenibacillus sp. FSL W8-0919 TaxID=2954707 RepID=UPI0030F6E823
MFRPLVVEVSLSFHKLDLKQVEFEWLRTIKEKYNFKETDININSIDLIDAFPLLRIQFKQDSIEISFAIKKGSIDYIKEFFSILTPHLDFKKITITQTELTFFEEKKNNSRFINLEFKETDVIEDVNIHFSIISKDDTPVNFRLIDSNNIDGTALIINGSPNKKISDNQELFDCIEYYRMNLTNIAAEYFSVEENSSEVQTI